MVSRQLSSSSSFSSQRSPLRLLSGTGIGVTCLVLGSSLLAASINTSPPATPVKLVFVHHSTGENWIRDDNGKLGIALRDSNYFVSDTNYDWGPQDQDTEGGPIGDHTDIGHWWNWFAGPHRDTYLTALYNESNTHSFYSRLSHDPGGQNRIVMFKSCFPNSSLMGSASDPIPSIASNPLKGQDSSSESMTVANAKGIYVEILKYFATRTDRLFIVVTAPPRIRAETDDATAANARAFNEWLRTKWLENYPNQNVFVFDFFNVLTSDGGSTRTNDPSKNDLGWADGNHHRVRNGVAEHMKTVANDIAAYGSSSDDSHPSEAGNLKATGEFPPLLNAAYHCWQGDGGCFTAQPPVTCTLSCQASVPATATAGQSVALTATVTATACTATPDYDWDFGDKTAHATQAAVNHTYTAAGSYTWRVTGSADGQSCTQIGTITVTEVQPPASYVYIVPAIVRSPGGFNSLWRSDVGAVNRSDVPITISLTFLAQDRAPVTRERALVARGAGEWADILSSVFGSTENISGTLQITSPQPLCVSSRTFTQGVKGTYGGYIPAVQLTDSLTAGRTGILPHLRGSSSYRTNIGVANLGAARVTVVIRLFGADGAPTGSESSVEIPPGETRQVNDIFATSGAGTHEIAYATVGVTTAGGQVWAYASVTDNGTNDPTIVPLLVP